MRIGIVLTGDYSWAGGVYYSLNIIKLLQAISQHKKLTVVVIVNSGTPAGLLKEIPSGNTEIRYLDKKPFFYKLYHKIAGNRFEADINALKLDVLYPLISYHPSHAKLNCKVFYWIYDFQHKFLPQLFTQDELKKRDAVFENIALSAKDLVFSSHDSKNHFDQFYPKSGARKHVYNFVSLISPDPDPAPPAFDIPQDYFIVCNQFWSHKNHMVVLRALDVLLKTEKRAHVVFTGKYDDERNKSYFDELRIYVREQQLEKHITLTGFISREEQVNLILGARAVIQPSFFEGWSTVVEDAKALGKFVIASNLNVNKEQIKKNVLFFEPRDYRQLAAYLDDLSEGKINITPLDYHQNIETSKNDLIELFKI